MGEVNTLGFRGIRERSFADQNEALAGGYNSVAEMAIDELARRLIALEERMERVEKHMGLSSYVAELGKQRDNDPED